MTSRMAAEIAECPRVAHDAAGMAPAFHRLAADFRQAPPPLVVLCGRGSSGHAALFLRYLFETRLLTPVSLAAPSVASAYKSRMRLAGAWFILLSQSGESPDLIEAARAAQAAGALTIGFVNAPELDTGKCRRHRRPAARRTRNIDRGDQERAGHDGGGRAAGRGNLRRSGTARRARSPAAPHRACACVRLDASLPGASRSRRCLCDRPWPGAGARQGGRPQAGRGRARACARLQRCGDPARAARRHP